MFRHTTKTAVTCLMLRSPQTSEDACLSRVTSDNLTGSPVSARLASTASTRRLQTRTARLAYSDRHSRKHHQRSACHQSHLDYSCKYHKLAGDRIFVASKDDRASDAWQHKIRICTIGREGTVLHSDACRVLCNTCPQRPRHHHSLHSTTTEIDVLQSLPNTHFA